MGLPQCSHFIWMIIIPAKTAINYCSRRRSLYFFFSPLSIKFSCFEKITFNCRYPLLCLDTNNVYAEQPPSLILLCFIAGGWLFPTRHLQACPQSLWSGSLGPVFGRAMTHTWWGWVTVCGHFPAQSPLCLQAGGSSPLASGTGGCGATCLREAHPQRRWEDCSTQVSSNSDNAVLFLPFPPSPGLFQDMEV